MVSPDLLVDNENVIIYDEAGKIRATMNAKGEVRLFDEAEQERARMDEGGFGVKDEAGKSIWTGP